MSTSGVLLSFLNISLSLFKKKTVSNQKKQFQKIYTEK